MCGRSIVMVMVAGVCSLVMFSCAKGGAEKKGDFLVKRDSDGVWMALEKSSWSYMKVCNDPKAEVLVREGGKEAFVVLSSSAGMVQVIGKDGKSGPEIVCSEVFQVPLPQKK